MITTWYLQSQRTWDKLCHSCIGSSFLPRGAFPEGRAYAFPQRLHAGSLEALRVSRPEAVVLAFNNQPAQQAVGGVDREAGPAANRAAVDDHALFGVIPVQSVGCVRDRMDVDRLGTRRIEIR